MDKKKKIIVSAVFVVFLIGIGFFIKSNFFDSEDISVKSLLDIKTPNVDEDDIVEGTKLGAYNKESPENPNSSNFNPFKRLEKTEELTDTIEEIDSTAGQQIDDELLALMKMQEEMMATEQTSPKPASIVKIAKEVIPEKERSLAEIRGISKESSAYFQGADQNSNPDGSLKLIPCETVDQGVLATGSTIAIRTKKDFIISNSRITVPKGTVLYGKTSFSGLDRLQIDIVSYKEGNNLNPIALTIYDFDGREGIHLGNNSWPKIPSKVAKEVLNYVRQRGTQQTAFGGNNGIDLDEAKDLATIATISEVASELVDRKRVFVPRKYNMWVNVNTIKNIQ